MGEITTHRIQGTTTIIYAAPGRFGQSLKRESEAGFMKLVSPAGDSKVCVFEYICMYVYICVYRYV
jgi:hypothetical protein